MKSTVSASTPTPTRPSRFVARLGKHHFAHLRGEGQGLDPAIAARHYLGIEHGHEAVTAHRQTVDAVRAVARRSSSGSAWRLIGLTIRPKTQDALKPPQKPAGSSAPTGRVRVLTLEEFIEERDLDGWSEGEVLQMHTEAFPMRVIAKGAPTAPPGLDLLDSRAALRLGQGRNGEIRP